MKTDFPVLGSNPELTYLDSACTSLKPQQVIDEVKSYYEEFSACSGRSAHSLARKLTERVENAREKVARFFNAKPDELIWTRNATEALNTVIEGLKLEGKKVITTVMEHHSVLVPLMRLEKEGKIKLEILPADREGKVSLEQWEAAIEDAALVVTNNGNNTTSIRQDLESIAKLAKDHGARVCIDAAQGAGHSRTDFKGANHDFYCFSGHKMLGPTGIGGLLVKEEVREELRAHNLGGGTVKRVSRHSIEYAAGPQRFEAGIQHYAGILGLKAACDYLQNKGLERIEEHDVRISDKLVEAVEEAGGKVYGGNGKRHGIVTFNIKDAKPHEVALLLDQQGIAVRSGFFCAQLALEALGAKDGAVRASAYLYNDEEDVRKFRDALKEIAELF